MKSSQVDWKSLERVFVEETGANVSLRKFADEICRTRPETNHQSLNYDMLKDHAKAGLWREKRARYLIETQPGLYTDAEVIYEMLREEVIESFHGMTPTERSSMSREIREWFSILQSRAALSMGDTEDNHVTRDEILEYVEKTFELDRDAIARKATQHFINRAKTEEVDGDVHRDNGTS